MRHLSLIAKDFFQNSPIYRIYLNFLVEHYFEFMTFHWIAIIVLFLMNLKNIKKILSKIDRKTWICLFLIFVFALSIKVINYKSIVYDSGNLEYINFAKNLKEKWSFCRLGNVNNCLEEKIPWYPGGWPYILSMMFLLFGASIKTSILTTVLIGSLLTISIFLLAYVLFENKKLSLISSFLIAIVPLPIKFSLSSHAVIPSLFFLSLAVFFILSSIKINKEKMYLFSFVFSYFAMQIRPGNFYFLVFMWILSFILFSKRDKKEIFKKIKTPFLISLLFIFPLLDVRIFSGLTYGNFWTGEGELIGLEYAKRDLLVLFSFLTDIRMNSFLFIFVVFSICVGIKNRIKPIYLLTFWFLIFSIAMVSYSNYDDLSHRYLISLYAPLVILSAFSITYLTSRVKYQNKTIFLILILIFSSLYVNQNIFSLYKNRGSEEKYLLLIDKKVNDNDILITDHVEVIRFENPNQYLLNIEYEFHRLAKFINEGKKIYYVKYIEPIPSYGGRHCHITNYKGRITDLCELIEENYETEFVGNFGPHELRKIVT